MRDDTWRTSRSCLAGTLDTHSGITHHNSCERVCMLHIFISLHVAHAHPALIESFVCSENHSMYPHWIDKHIDVSLEWWKSCLVPVTGCVGFPVECSWCFWGANALNAIRISEWIRETINCVECWNPHTGCWIPHTRAHTTAACNKLWAYFQDICVSLLQACFVCRVSCVVCRSCALLGSSMLGNVYIVSMIFYGPWRFIRRRVCVSVQSNSVPVCLRVRRTAFRVWRERATWKGWIGFMRF